MKRHPMPTALAAVAAALLLGVASTAAGQTDTTRTRVPVTKERPATPTRSAGVPVTKATTPAADTVRRASPGEVSLPRDTAPPRVETPVAATPATPMPRPASQPFQMPREPRYLFGNSGFTMGAAFGAAMPTGTFRELGYDPGAHAAIPIGWHRPGTMLGVRATFTFDKPTRGSSEMLHAAPGVPRPASDPRIYTATLDAVLKLPLLGMGTDGYGIAAYAVGGGGGYRFEHYGTASPLADAVGSAAGKSRVTRWGVHAGGGLEWGRGPTSFFVESRWVNVFADGSRTRNDYLRWVPVVVGVTIH
jgi:hypothetical protein